jgi:glucose/arabinose dehydrogenase
MFTLLFTFALGQLQNEYWTVDYLSPPTGEVLEVGGIGFMSDGDLVASTRRGQVWRVDNPNAVDPNDATFSLICEGLHEGLGLSVLDDEIYVMQRGEISKLVDLDGDTIIDEVQTITQDWGMSGNYHEFGFGLPVDKDGNMYFSLNVGFWNPEWWHGKSRAPYRGWVLKLSKDGAVTPIAGGLRSPAGLGLLEDGTLLVTDNQGDWMPVCPVFAIKEGAFYGHPASLRWYEDQPDIEPSDTQPHPEIEREHPALWLPYQWSRSTGNVIQDVTDGPFQGQYLLAELTNGQILRAQFEKIDGVLQGACWLAHQRVGSAYHIKYGPDETLYAGMTNRGWGGLAPGSGIARIKYNGELPLEMNGAHLIKNGFEISFTKPLANIPSVSGNKYDYNYWWEYGSPQQHVEDLLISDVALSDDGLKAIVTIDNLEAGKCIMLKFDNASSKDGSTLLHPEMSYTINKIPDGELIYVAKQVEPPVERGEQVEGWLYLTWADATDVWVNNGVTLCNAELDIDNPTKFVISDGDGALVASEGESMATKFNIVDGEVKFAYMLAKESEAEIKLPIGISVLLSSEQSGGYLGEGIWHEARLKFQANPPKVTLIEINGVHTDANLITYSGVVKPSPLEIKCTKGNFAFGDVRFRTKLKTLDSSEWESLQSDERTWKTTGDINCRKTEDDDFLIVGSGSIDIPFTNTGFSLIRFDCKINGAGNAIILIGDIELTISTSGDYKTGSINGYPIKANLVDQNEWCTVEIQQDENTTVSINDIPILTIDDAPNLTGDTMRIKVNDAELTIRKTYLSN